MSGIDPTLVRRMERTANAAALLVAAAGASVLVGWALDIPELKSVFPNLSTMKINTATSLLLCGVALWLKMRTTASSLPHRLSELLAGIAAMIGLLTVVQHAFDINLHIDQLFGTDSMPNPSGYPGRMSVATALCIMAIGTAIVLLDHLTRTSQALSLFTLAMATLGLTGYAYSVEEFYRVKIFNSMALHTAAALALLAIGHLSARPRRCVHHLLTSDSVGGRMTRGMLPAIIAVPLLVGWARLKGQQAGLYGTEFGLALLVISTIIILIAVVWYNAGLLDRSDRVRQHLQIDRDDLLAREQTARQRAEQAVMARDQFLAVVSHELRTPLTPMMLLATALSKNPRLPTEVIDDLQTICEQIQIESKLIGDLLDIVSLGQGAITLRPQWIDVNQLARSAVATFSRTFAHKQIRLTGEYLASRSQVCADPARFAQALGYLLDNALKFTPADGQVRLRTFDDVESRLGVELVDTGIGIRAEAMNRLFGAFEPGDRSMTRTYGGLGLGLKIARALVELHGGTLSAASEGENRGAKFTIRLPGARDGSTSPKPGEPCGNGSHLRILLVEDNVQTLRAFERLLRVRGHMVKAATSAGEALAAAQGKAFDLLICDIGLPDRTGWELLAALKDQGPITGIAVSGFATDEDRDRSLKAGFAAHLIKPIDMSQLEQAIAQAHVVAHN